MELIVRNKEDLATAIEAVCRGINNGCVALVNANIQVTLPDKIKFSGIFLGEANVGSVTASGTSTSPESTVEETTPERIVSKHESRGQRVVNETSKPSGQTTKTSNSGSDKSTTDYEYQS